MKMLRYGAVSVVSVAVSETTLIICAAVFGLSGVLSNTIATIVSTVPSYELNRKWVWGKRGKSHLWKEVVPFWALAFIGWGLSTWAVHYADDVANGYHITHLERSFIYALASLTAFGVVWIVKFIIFNKVLFKHRHDHVTVGVR